MIPVTKPFLPPIAEYNQLIEGIWQREWLTNMGPLSNELELALKEYLDVKHLLWIANGTIALQMAIKVLALKGEIITTPFSFVATTSVIAWEGCTPVFVDIDKHSLNIDADKIEAAVTDKTVAILATHVYGNPCDVEKIEKIAQKHNLKIIYDGAHAFGIKINNKSIFEYGDISICSLHATKLYHSTEGGLIITKNPEIVRELAFMRNFGFNGPDKFENIGINGKNSEFHAAMGLCNLKYIGQILERRLRLSELYDLKLKGLNISTPRWHPSGSNNHAYYPVIFETESAMIRSMEYLKLHEIYTRRYFYPSLATSLPYVVPKHLDITDNISERVLCLPLYHTLSETEVEMICRFLLRVQNNNL